MVYASTRAVHAMHRLVQCVCKLTWCMCACMDVVCMHVQCVHKHLPYLLFLWAYGVVVSMFDFHHSDQGSNPGRGGKVS